MNQNPLSKLGLNENQAKVYSTLLQLGSAQVQELAQKTNRKRTTIYAILDSLMQKGLIGMNQKGAHREYFAENPQKIPGLLEQEAAEIKERQREVAEIIPQLASLYNAHATKPIIRTYEGLEGIKAVFEETLTLPSGTETLAFVSYSNVRSHLQEYIKSFITRRAEKGITQRCISEDSIEAREDLVNNDTRDLRITRLVNKEQFPFPVDQINIFGNKVFIASYKDLLAVVIESESVAIALRSAFELAWLGALRNI